MLLSPLHEALKSATQTSHQQIERNPRLQRLMQNDLALPEFTLILERYWGFYHRMASVLPNGSRPTYPISEKIVALGHDLKLLTGADPDDLPSCEYLPAPSDLAEATGYTYVLAGSALGGRLIGRHLAQFDFAQGLVFFNANGPDVSAGWKVFLDELAACDQSPTYRQSAATAAVRAFTVLDLWMHPSSELSENPATGRTT